MKRIYIFTEDYRDILTQWLPNARPYNFGGLDCLTIEHEAETHVAGELAQITTYIMGNEMSGWLEAKLNDFLSENEYIHLDAFIRICLEDIDD